MRGRVGLALAAHELLERARDRWVIVISALFALLAVVTGLAVAGLQWRETRAAERRAVLATMGTPDQREGIQAFLEKRKPRFNRGSE